MRRETRVLSIYLLGVFVGALDHNVLAPVLPLVARHFDTTLAWTAWALTTYTVAYVASTGLSGPLGDRYGRRRVFGLGVATFGLASLVAALAPNFWTFLLARFLQGAGAGAVYPNAQAEGVALFPPERRGLALGIFGAVFGLASIVGPNVGGALGQYFGWPAIFLLNVPLVLGVLTQVPALPVTRDRNPAGADWAGGVSFAAFLAAALLALSAGNGRRWLFLALAALALLLFTRRQRQAAAPFLDARAWATGPGLALIAGAALIGLDMSAAAFVPTLTQQTFGFSILQSGVALMPAALSGAVLAGVGGALVDRLGARRVLQVGLGAGAVGGALLAFPRLTFPLFLAAMMALGLATAFTMGAPLNHLALGLYRAEQAGEALSMVAVFRSVGLAAGPVLLTLAYQWRSFSGMFGEVVVASLVAFFLFFGVPEARRAGVGARGGGEGPPGEG